MGISQTFNVSIYKGAAVNPDVPASGPVAIGGHVYQIEPTRCVRRTLEVLRASSDVGAETGEQSLNTHGLWRRTTSDWSLGAGQLYYDEPDSKRNRFYRSKGIDPWTKRLAKLLPDTQLNWPSSATNLLMVNVAGSVLLADNDLLQTTVDNGGAWATTAAGGPITGLDSDGTYVYAAATGFNIYRGAIGGPLASWSAFQADSVGYGNGVVLAGRNNRLCQISAAGAFGTAGQLDYSHMNPNFKWKGFVPTPSCIYAWGDAGGVSEVYSITIDPATGNLRTPVWAWTVPLGETITSMLWANTVMAIGSTLGVRLATQNASNNTLQGGALVETSIPAQALCAYRNFVWFGWNNYDSTSTGLGRMNVADLVDADALVPAYASDLMASTQGAVKGCVSNGDFRMFSVSGHGVYRQVANLTPVGTIDGGWMSFSTIERKVAVSVDMRHEPLAGTVSLAMDIELDQAQGGQRVQLSTSALQGTLGPTSPFGAANTPFEQTKLLTTVTRSATDATKGPAVRRETVRAIPTPIRTDEIIIAIRLWSRNDQFSPLGVPGQDYMDPTAEFTYLKELEASGSIIRFQTGTHSDDVYIDGIELASENIAPDGSFLEGLCNVHMLTVTPAA